MKKIISVCDSNEKYAVHLSDALSEKTNGTFTVTSFCDMKSLKGYLETNSISQLIVSSMMAGEVPETDRIEDVVVLGEEGLDKMLGYDVISRYQRCDSLVRSLIDYMADRDLISPVKPDSGRKLNVIGVYSPVKRCLQTTFSMALGERLAMNAKVLYLNFEGFSGFSGMMRDNTDTGREYDITDMLYYFDCDRDKLPMKLSAMVRTINGMDFLPPASSYFETYERTGEKWIDFFKGIEQCGIYDYLVLDLSEAVQGLMQILEYCGRIFMIVKNDRIASAKIGEYEKWVEKHDLSGILERTTKCSLPVFHDIPEEFGLLTHGELAEFVQRLVSGDAA